MFSVAHQDQGSTRMGPDLHTQPSEVPAKQHYNPAGQGHEPHLFEEVLVQTQSLGSASDVTDQHDYRAEESEREGGMGVSREMGVRRSFGETELMGTLRSGQQLQMS